MASTNGNGNNTDLLRFQRLFKGRETMHGRWRSDIKGRVIKGPVTEEAWREHLNGGDMLNVRILGIGPTMLDNQCYFGAIDLDDRDKTDHQVMAALVEREGLPLITVRSKSGGYHFFLFLKDPASAELVKKRLTEWVKRLKLQNPPGKNGVRPPVEVYPKQVSLKANQDGNWINLPYYGADDPVSYAVATDEPRLSFKRFLQTAERAMITSGQLEAWTQRGGTTGFFDKGPPCLNSLHDLGFPEGQRNSGLQNVAIYLKQAFTDWQDRLRAYNESGKVTPPLKERELTGIIHSVETHEYNYNCDDLPIKPHCQKGECKKQKYGVLGKKRERQEEQMPDLANLRKITTDPPRWLLDVDEAEIELGTEDLMLVPRVRKAVMERCSIIFPLMRQGDWDNILIELLANLITIEAPEDAGVSGQFKALVREFLQRRTQAESREDLLAGMPYEEGPKTYFRAQDLLAFLTRKHFREYDGNRVYTELRRQFGVGRGRWNVKKATVQYWFVDTPQDDQQEEFTPIEQNEVKF